MSWICVRCRARFETARQRCPHDNRRVVADLSGEVIGDRYTIRELLGVGGMEGSVWLAWQNSTQREVAIKLLPPITGDAAARFTRGARIASNLNHPNITTVHDYGQTRDNGFYLVMELLEGQTLHRVIRQGPLPPERAINITIQVLAALAHAHKKQIVHRDIKPGNIYLVPDGVGGELVKVLDYGIARFVETPELDLDVVAEITTTRQICGTPQYMAPEQVAFGTVDGRTDLYALGVVLYRMLTGRLPFESKNHRELFRAHLQEKAPPFAVARPDLNAPPELEALVMRTLAKAPNARFASAAEMRTAIKLVRQRMGFRAPDREEPTPLSELSEWPTPEASTEEGAPRKWVLLGLVAVLCVAGFFVWLMRGPPEPPRDVVVIDTVSGDVAVGSAGADSALQDAGLGDARLGDARLGEAEPDTGATSADGGTLASDGGAAPPDAPPQLTSLVKLVSQPTGASVSRDGEVLGETPFEQALPAGDHTLTLSKRGYRPETVTITLADAQPFAQAVTLARTRRKTRPSRPKAPVVEAPKVEAPKVEAPATPPVKTKPAVKMLGEEPKGPAPQVEILQ